MDIHTHRTDYSAWTTKLTADKLSVTRVSVLPV